MNTKICTSDYPLTELDQLSDHFNILSALPATARSSLLQHLTKVMEHKEAVSSLQYAVRWTEERNEDTQRRLKVLVYLAFFKGIYILVFLCLSLNRCARTRNLS